MTPRDWWRCESGCRPGRMKVSGSFIQHEIQVATEALRIEAAVWAEEATQAMTHIAATLREIATTYEAEDAAAEHRLRKLY